MNSKRSIKSHRRPFYEFGLQPQFAKMAIEKPEEKKILGFGTLPNPPAVAVQERQPQWRRYDGSWNDGRVVPSPVFLDMNMTKNSDGSSANVGFAFNQAPDGSLSKTSGINKYARIETPLRSNQGEKAAKAMLRDLYKEKLQTGRQLEQPFGMAGGIADRYNGKPEFMKERWNPDIHPDQVRLMELGYPVSSNRNVIVDDSQFPNAMLDGMQDRWATQRSLKEQGKEIYVDPRHDLDPIPQNLDLFDALGDRPQPMIKPLPMSVLTSQGEQPVMPAQALQSMDYLNQDQTGNFVPAAAPGDGAWKLNPNSPGYIQAARDEYDHTPEDYRRQVPFEQFLAEQPGMVNLPPSAMAGAGTPMPPGLSQKTAAMQGASMGATPGMIQPNQTMGQFPQPQYGAMSSPQMQGQMQDLLLGMMGRQRFAGQYNDMQMARDSYDDAWDRARSDFLNPLMGGLFGGRAMASMDADSAMRRNQIQNRRNMRRQYQQDNWEQTKDLINMIAANDPQAIKNQFAMAKIQNDTYQKQINAQNANTQQFGAYSNANYKSGMLSVAQDNARRGWSNLERLKQEGADRSAQGWRRIAQEQAKVEQSLAMRQAELEQRKAEAAQRGDQFAMQMAFRDEQELNDEAYRYQKLKDDMELHAEGLNADGSSKVSDEFRKKYGIERPETKPADNNPMSWLNFFEQMGFKRPGATAPVSTQTKISSKVPPASAAPKSPQVAREKALAELARKKKAGAGKPVTPELISMLKGRYGNDMQAAKAHARKLGYRVD